MSDPLHRRVQYLLLKGATAEDVQDILGLTPSAYANQVARITRSQVDAAYAARVLNLELDRLDVLQQAHWDAAATGSFDALHAVLAIMKRRASYLGLDAPTQQPTSSTFVDVLASMSSHPAAAQHRITSDPPTDKDPLN